MWFLFAFSCWCGTTRASFQCSSTRSTWPQWRLLHGPHTNTGCWPLEGAQPIAASASGTLSRGSLCSAQTLALRSVTWPGLSTPTNWWVKRLLSFSMWNLSTMSGVCVYRNVFLLHLQVSTHGYSQNQILVWKYPSLTQVAKLTGHSYRVLYLVSILPV